MTKKRLILFVSLVTMAICFVNSQVVTIETVLDTNKIELGDRIELSYILEKKDDVQVIPPTYNDTLILGVEILDGPFLDSTKLKKDKVRLEQKLVLTSFEVGKYFIPPQAFAVKNSEGVDTVLSKASYFDVVGVALDTTGVIRDIAGLEHAPIIFRDFLPLIILIGIALIVFLVVYFVKKKRNEKVFDLKKPKEPAHIIALRELDKLKAQKLWQQNELKEYYSKLTYIIREYIENQFGVFALERTTDEILLVLKQGGLNRKIDMKQLEQLLKLADLIKFAKGEALPEENIAHLDNAYALIKSTYQKVEEELATEKNEIEE